MKMISALVIAHEISHFWFGDLVTMVCGFKFSFLSTYAYFSLHYQDGDTPRAVILPVTRDPSTGKNAFIFKICAKFISSAYGADIKTTVVSY